MDIKLLEIVQTLCIGTFSLTLIVFFYFLFNKCFVKERFNQQKFLSWISNDVLKGENLKTGYLSLALLLVYFLGIIASDLTERLTDSNNYKEKSYVLRELNWLAAMPSVGEIRRLALIDSDDSLTTLGNSVFSSYELVREANQFNNSRFYLLSDSTLVTQNKDSLTKSYLEAPGFDKFIALLFYTAKNWCYSRDHEPLHELKSIQNRIDLSRSTVLLCAVALQVIALMYVIFFSLNIQYLGEKKDSENNQQLRRLFGNVSFLVLRSVMIFLVIGILCRECFQITLLSYNKRAYGYYTSYLAKPESMENKER